MSTVNIRIDDKLKDEVHGYFEQAGIKPSDAVRGLYEYVRTHRALPFRNEILSDEDFQLLQEARNRVNDGATRIRVDLDALRSNMHIRVPPEGCEGV